MVLGTAVFLGPTPTATNWVPDGGTPSMAGKSAVARFDADLTTAAGMVPVVGSVRRNTPELLALINVTS